MKLDDIWLLASLLMCFSSNGIDSYNLVLQISSHFTVKLLGNIRDILRKKEINKVEDESEASAEMSRLSGNVKKGDATLEFIKHVCAVLALDQNVQHDVLVIINTQHIQ